MQQNSEKVKSMNRRRAVSRNAISELNVGANDIIFAVIDGVPLHDGGADHRRCTTPPPEDEIDVSDQEDPTSEVQGHCQEQDVRASSAKVTSATHVDAIAF